MNPNKALWEKGDFTEIAALMRQSGEAVVRSLGITTPLRGSTTSFWSSRWRTTGGLTGALQYRPPSCE
jgi:hypothetical protein